MAAVPVAASLRSDVLSGPATGVESGCANGEVGVCLQSGTLLATQDELQAQTEAYAHSESMDAISPPGAGDSDATVLNQAMGNLMGDAPACDVCGTITVRNGVCYKCMNCGNSLGCS